MVCVLDYSSSNYCAHSRLSTYHWKSGTYIPLLSAMIHKPCLIGTTRVYAMFLPSITRRYTEFLTR